VTIADAFPARAPAAIPRRREHSSALSSVAAIIALATAIGLVLRLYRLTRPGYLLGAPEYDDGEYLGTAIRFAAGVMPYRDFIILQPPGVAVLMAPLGFLAQVTGSATAMVVARILTVLAGTASIPLAGRLVRHQGPVAVALCCGILAVFPDAINASTTLYLEPWVDVFVLLGALALFDGDATAASGKRLVWGGVAVGLAGAIKAFAVFPALAWFVLVAAHRQGRRGTFYLVGVVAGFAIPVAPFVTLAPRRAFNAVILVNLHRDVVRIPVASRLGSLFGLASLNLGPSGVDVAALVIGLAIAACPLAATLLTRRLPPALEQFALLAAFLSLVAFLAPTGYWPHYAAFFAPFLSLSVALPAARLSHAVTTRWALSRHRQRAVATASVAAVALFAAMALRDYRSESLLRAYIPPSTLQQVIPAGACVLTDISSFTIMANRFVSDVPGCSQIVDAIATDEAFSGGRRGVNGAGRYPAVARLWMDAFRHAQFVWLKCVPPGAASCDRNTNKRIPWTPQIRGYLLSHFHPLPEPGVFIRNQLPESQRGIADATALPAGWR